MITFSQQICGSYDLDELERLDSLVQALPPSSVIVEIGVQYGRTASLYLSSGQHQVYLIDSWVENEGDAWPAFNKLVNDNDWSGRFHGLWITSSHAVDHVPDGIDLLHIDGGHTPEAVWADCKNFLPKLKVGGIVVFHDYHRRGKDLQPVFPGVDAAVDAFTGGPKWADFGTVNTQAVRKKLSE